MFSPVDYPKATSNAAVVIHVPASTDLVTPTSYRVDIDITDDNAVSYPVIIRQSISVTVETPEFYEKPRWKPEQMVKYAPAVREIVRPWQSKWRLKQQRPRDGLNAQQ